MLVLFTWLFFRAKDFNTVQIFLSKLINWHASEYSYRLVIVAFSFLILTILMDIIMYYTNKHTYILLIKKKSISWALLFSMFVITVLYMFQSDPLPFVYFQF